MKLVRAYVLSLAAGAAYLGWSIVGAQLDESVVTAGPTLAALPWGWVTIVDVYLGFVAFGGYIVAREGSAGRAIPWLLALFVVGNIASAAYVVSVLLRHRLAFRALTEREPRPAARRT
jgi:hypothetical protein